MHRTIRLATYEDIPAIMPVIDAAREMCNEPQKLNTKLLGFLL